MNFSIPQNLKVTVVGVGYIGLPTASILASRGYDVTGVDTNLLIIDELNSGSTTIQEPGLGDLLKAGIENGNLRGASGSKSSDIFIVAVPTPFTENKTPDLRFLYSAVDEIASKLKPGNLVILESTIPVGTTEEIGQRIEKLRSDLIVTGSENTKKKIFLAHCPERVLPGRILTELVENNRIIGGVNSESTKKAISFYKTFVNGELLATNSKTAEFAKLAENTFRDVNIALANEFSILSKELNINVWEMIELANHHPRVNILNPGPGVGGHCIAVDPWFLVNALPKSTKLIRAAREVNDDMPNYIVKTVKESLKLFANPTVACLGLSYKANVSDVRESPAMQIVELLGQQLDLNLILVEPNINSAFDKFNSTFNIKFSNLDNALLSSDIVLLLVGHKEFENINPILLKNKIIIDTIGFWESK